MGYDEELRGVACTCRRDLYIGGYIDASIGAASYAELWQWAIGTASRPESPPAAPTSTGGWTATIPANQLATCFRKFAQTEPEYIELLLEYFARRESYTRRMALDALVEHEHEHAIERAVELWEVECEFARLTALYAFQKSPGGDRHLTDYLERFMTLYDPDAEPHRRTHIDRLRSGR